MSDSGRHHDVIQPTRRSWYTSRVLLAVVFILSYVGFFGVIAAVAYMRGRQQYPPLSLGVPILLLLVLVIVSAVVLVLQSLRGPKPIQAERRASWVISLATILCVIACLVLPFTRFRPPVYMAMMYGFRDYARANVDVEAVQAWLKTLDPKICTGQYNYELNSGCTIECWWPDAAPWAKGVTPANPDFATLHLDEGGRPMIRIMWLGMFMSRDYGLVVGDEQMETPRPDFFGHREYRMPLAPGAWIWYEN